MNLNSECNILKEWAKNHPEIAEVFIYGSRVTGTNSTHSDLDIAIRLDPNAMDYNHYSNEYAFESEYRDKWSSELQSLIDLTIDLRFYNPQTSKRVGTGKRVVAYQKFTIKSIDTTK